METCIVHLLNKGAICIRIYFCKKSLRDLGMPVYIYLDLLEIFYKSRFLGEPHMYKYTGF